jgi:hypothetical protein
VATPPTAILWDEILDPSEIIDYTVDLTPLLATGEGVASFTVIPYSESALVGLTVGVSSYAPTIDANKILTVWLSIASAKQTDPAFSGTGSQLPLELSFTTTSIPPRKRQRTLLVQVAQR